MIFCPPLGGCIFGRATLYHPHVQHIVSMSCSLNHRLCHDKNIPFGWLDG